MRRGALGAVLGALLLLWGSVAYAQAAGAFQITWQHTQDQATLATNFVIRRCVQSGTLCTMADLQGASSLPYGQFSYTDLAIQPNVTYCYLLLASNTFGRSPPSSQICGKLGAPPVNAPGNVQLNIVTVP